MAAVAEPPAVRTRFGSPEDPDRPESLRAVAISPDGRLVALAGEPETPTDSLAVQIRDSATGELIRTLGGHEGPVRSLAFSPRGDRLATVTSNADGVGVLRVFETKTEEPAQVIDAGGRIVRFLPDGRLAIAGFGKVLVFDPATGREVGRHPAMPVVKDVSRDGGRVLGVSHHGRGELEVRDLGTGKPVARLSGCAAEPLAAAFSPDGRTVAAADQRTRAVIVWEVLTGQEVHRLGSEMTVTALAFTADGRHLLAGGFGDAIRGWEVATGTPTGRLAGHEGAVLALAVGPNETLLSGATDRTAVLWSLAAVRGTSLSTGPLAEADFDAAWEALA
ncbi:MAG TPA: WD40 repeat domain-containing protein, partial [Planctomycetaceae bacterium]